MKDCLGPSELPMTSNQPLLSYDKLLQGQFVWPWANSTKKLHVHDEITCT